MSHKILVAQGGGPTAVINQSLAGVVLEARRFSDDHARLRRGARRARHHRRRPRRPVAGDHRQSRSGRRHAGRRARLDPRQARRQVLPGNLQGAEGAPDRHVLLHRRQRFLRHGAHRRGRGGQGRRTDPRDPHPQDDRQRPRRLRPYAGLSRPRRASSPRPSPAPTSTTPRCRASIARSSWAATPASSPRPRRWRASSPATART